MNEKKNKEKNILEFLTLIKVIFSCPYKEDIFIKDNLKDIKEITLKKLYPITYLIKDVNFSEEYNSLKNEPILYFPSAKKITVKVDEKNLPAPTRKFDIRMIFEQNPANSGDSEKVIGGELYVNYDCDPSYEKNNTLLDIFTIYELILSIKNKNKKDKFINALNSNLKEKFNSYAKIKREKISTVKGIKKKIYNEHFDYYKNTNKIEKYYQYKTLISIKKGKSKILFDGYNTEEEANKFLIRAFENIIVFYKIFFTDILLN